jgi:hypothetical protein
MVPSLFLGLCRTRARRAHRMFDAHDAMASIAARAARRATSKSSMSGAVAAMIALAAPTTHSGAARIAGSLYATCAQNVPKAALQRPAKGTSIGSPGAPAS